MNDLIAVPRHINGAAVLECGHVAMLADDDLARQWGRLMDRGRPLRMRCPQTDNIKLVTSLIMRSTILEHLIAWAMRHD
jgi:hypothetical protein